MHRASQNARARTGTSSERDRWLGVELRHLAALAAVAHEGSFRGAAASLGYVQSAVSQQIMCLERLVGLRLIERSRGPRPIRMTEAGQMLLGHADSILAQLRAARAELALLADRVGTNLRVGVDGAVTRRLLPAVLTELAAERPDLAVIPIDVPVLSERLALVARGDLEMAFVDLPVPDASALEVTELFADPQVLVVPLDSDLAESGRELTAADLALVATMGSGARRFIRPGRARGAAGGRDAVADSTAQALVAAGHGAAIVPRLAFDDHAGTVPIDVGDLVEPRLMGLCWPRRHGQDTAVLALRTAAERACVALQPVLA